MRGHPALSLYTQGLTPACRVLQGRSYPSVGGTWYRMPQEATGGHRKPQDTPEGLHQHAVYCQADLILPLVRHGTQCNGRPLRRSGEGQQRAQTLCKASNLVGGGARGGGCGTPSPVGRPEGSRETPRWHPGGPGNTQETSRRHPGDTQRHPGLQMSFWRSWIQKNDTPSQRNAKVLLKC